jgi:YD repeat-containing protein
MRKLPSIPSALSTPLAFVLLLTFQAPAQYVETHGWSFEGGNLIANWSFENLSSEICGPLNPFAYESLTDCRLKTADTRSGNYVMRAHMKNEGPSTPISWAVSQTSEHLLVKPITQYRFEVQYQVDWTEGMSTARAVVGFLDGLKNPIFPFAEGPFYHDLDNTDVGVWSTYGFTFETPPQTRYIYFHLVQVDNDGAVGDGDVYLFDNLHIREVDAPATVLESRSYLDAIGRVDHSIFADGTHDIISKNSYDNFGRLQEAYLPFTTSGLILSDITVSAMDLTGELPVDFPTLQQGYTALSQAVATTMVSALPAEINLYIITPLEGFAPTDPQVATLVPLVSVDGQVIPFNLNGTVYGSQDYLDLVARRSGTSTGHQTKGPFTGDVQAALLAQYPGESNLFRQMQYPTPGLSRTQTSSLPGNLYGPSAHVRKSGSALIRSPALPSDAEAGGNTDPFQADYRYSWSLDPQGRYSAQVVSAEGLLVRSGVSRVPSPTGEADWLVSQNEYDIYGRLTHTRSPENLFTTFAYDGQSRTILTDDPDRGITDYLYDTPGRLRFSRSTHGLANGYFIANRYDLAGRMLGWGKVDQPTAFTQINADDTEFPPYATLDQGYLYDALEPARFVEATGVTLSELGFVPPVKNGQGQSIVAFNRNLETEAPGVTQAKDKLVATFNSYDSLGRLQDRWQYLGPSLPGKQWHNIRYNYDTQDRLHSVAVYDDAEGTILSTFSKYIYDNQGRVSQVVDETGLPISDYSYDFQSRLNNVELLSKVKMSYKYDIQGKTRSLEALAESFSNPHVFSEYLGYEDKPLDEMTNPLDPVKSRFDGGISNLVRKF